jgi:hypothetical protein
MPEVLDPYAILELQPGTPMAQVKAQFRRLAKSVHPDRHGNDVAYQERLRRINAAYEFLSDPVRKADFDAYLARRELPELPEHEAVSVRSTSGWGGGSSRAVSFFVFLAVLVCVIVAVICALSQQTPSFSDAVPTASVVEPTGPVVGSSEEQPFVAPSGETVPASSGSGLWPASTTPTNGEPVPTAVTPLSGTAPAPRAAWSTGDTGSFPSQ